MKVKSVQALVKSCGDLASLPSVYERLSAVIRNRKATANDIGKVVSEDPSLTARLLRLVNSAFFGFPSKIETISRAVMVVGTDQLRDLCLATSVIHMFDGIKKQVIDMQAFWKHSLSTGVAARALAKIHKENNVERFFVAGLLHDIGRLILYVKSGDEMADLIQRSRTENLLLDQLENEFFGYDHCQVGGALITEWNLPESLNAAVLFHHDPSQTKKFTMEALYIHFADIIANALEMGTSGGYFVPPPHTELFQKLNLKVEQIPFLLTEIKDQAEEAVKAILQT